MEGIRDMLSRIPLVNYRAQAFLFCPSLFFSGDRYRCRSRIKPIILSGLKGSSFI